MDHDNLSAEEIAKIYSSAMDSKNLVHAALADPGAYEYDPGVVLRNVEHLKIVVGWDFWTDENLTPFHDAIEAGSE